MTRQAFRLLILLFILSVCLVSETNSSYFDTELSQANTITAGCWVTPSVPVLSSPLNNTFADSTWLANPVMAWTPSSFHCPRTAVTYVYQSAYDPLFTQIAYTSSPLTLPRIPAPNTPENTYYWHVKACDSLTHCSDWSDPFKFTVDRTAPIARIDSPSNSAVLSGMVDILGTVTDQNPHHYWLVIQDDSNHTVAGPGTVNSSVSFTNKVLFSWDTSGFPDGLYKIKLEARDAAQNKTTASVHWLTVTVDNSPPVSTIDPEGILDGEMLNTPDITIPYTVTDDNFDYVRLCVSVNMADWDCPGSPEFTKSVISGSFNYHAPTDGRYSFALRAYDQALHSEDEDYDSRSIFLVVDTTPPTSNLDLSVIPDSYSGQNLVANGDFTGGLTGWTAGTGSSLSAVAGAMTLSSGSFFQVVPIPSNLSSTFSFNYRFLSDDIVENDHFDVRILDMADNVLTNVLTLGNTSPSNLSWDSGWRHIGRSLIAFAGQTIKLWFGLTDTNPLFPLSSSVDIDNIAISTLDTRVGDIFPIIIQSEDNLSGVQDSNSDPDILAVGDTTVTFHATDIASNTEPPGQFDVVVLPAIVINKVAFNLVGDGTVDVGTSGSDNGEWVEIRNNSTQIVTLDGWSLKSQTSGNIDIPLSILGSGSTLVIYRSGDPDFDLDDHQDSVSLHSSTQQIDITGYNLPQDTEGGIWLRTPTGLGPFALDIPAKTLTANLVYRPSLARLTMTIDTIPTAMPSFTYEILYTVNLDSQGISGTVANDPPQVRIDRDLFLGTCSTADCIAHTGIGDTFTLNIYDGNNNSLFSQTFSK